MRLWHQSTTDLSRLLKYRENICRHAGQVLDAGVTVEPHGFPKGAYGNLTSYKVMDFMKFPYIKLLNERIVCEAAIAAEQEGFDAMAIGCNLDIGLRYCRSIVDIPVVGVTESSMHVACLLGKKFAYITISDFMKAHLTASVEEYGLTDRLARVLTMDAPFQNDKDGAEKKTDAHGSSPISRYLTEDAEKAEKIFLETCEKAMAMGADVFIPGEGILNEWIFERKLTHFKGIPILDANAALWHCAVMMANLKARSNITISRGFTYNKPDEAMMNQTREFQQARRFVYADFT